MTTPIQQRTLNRVTYDQAFGRTADGRTNFAFRPGHTSPQIGEVKDRIRQALGEDLSNALGLTRGNTLTQADLAAIRVYQAGNGLAVDGIIGAETGRQARDVGQTELPITDPAAMRRQIAIEQRRMGGNRNLDVFANPPQPPVVISPDGGTRLEPRGSTYRAGSDSEMERLRTDAARGPAANPALPATAALPPTATPQERDAALGRDVRNSPGLSAPATMRAAERAARLQQPAPNAELIRMPTVEAGPNLQSTQALLRAGIPEPHFAAALEASLVRDVRGAADPAAALRDARRLLSEVSRQGTLSNLERSDLDGSVFAAARERDPNIGRR